MISYIIFYFFNNGDIIYCDTVNYRHRQLPLKMNTLSVFKYVAIGYLIITLIILVALICSGICPGNPNTNPLLTYALTALIWPYSIVYESTRPHSFQEIKKLN